VSAEAATALLERVTTDEEFRARLKAATVRGRSGGSLVMPATAAAAAAAA
jgi:hypothetical protein